MFYPLGILEHPWAILGCEASVDTMPPKDRKRKLLDLLNWNGRLRVRGTLIRTPHSQLSNLSSISIESRLCMSFVIFCLHVLYCFDSRRIHLNSQVSCQPLPAMALLCPSSRSGMIWAKDGKNMQTHAIQDTAWHSMVQNRERIRMDKIK